MKTGFLLLLEVKSSGKRGEFYVSYKFTDQDPVGGKESIPTFPNAPAPFTLAKASPTDLDSRALDLRILQTGALLDGNEIDLVPVSDSTLEIAETGIRKNWTSNNPPIPLFPLNSQYTPPAGQRDSAYPSVCPCS
jgi:hypothetical protein